MLIDRLWMRLSHQFPWLFSSSLLTFFHKKNKKCPAEKPHWPSAQKLSETPVIPVMASLSIKIKNAQLKNPLTSCTKKLNETPVIISITQVKSWQSVFLIWGRQFQGMCWRSAFAYRSFSLVWPNTYLAQHIKPWWHVSNAHWVTCGWLFKSNVRLLQILHTWCVAVSVSYLAITSRISWNCNRLYKGKTNINLFIIFVNLLCCF